MKQQREVGAAELKVDRRLGLDLYRTIRLIRRFEERVVELVNADEIPGVTHEYVGQEAVAAGVCAALRRDDVITSTHRGHGHVLARGADPARMMAELMGRTTGLNRGRGGSMHIADVGLGIYGANGIVAAGAPIAAGAAWAAKVGGSDRVAVTFFGDGGINQGVLHETMNLAAIWRLPIIFCCENNGYAVTMPAAAASALPIKERAAAYGFPVESVDGMDPEAVFDATAVAVDRARSAGGASFIECRTYRYFGHHTAERMMKLTYRTQDEVDAWRKRDPVITWPQTLAARGWMDEREKAAIDEQVEKVLNDAVELARKSPQPEAGEALRYMYAEWRPEWFPPGEADG
jgi:acetoin:2,6-dichlorophenolindophenol oxidoreductase subunit alpha